MIYGGHTQTLLMYNNSYSKVSSGPSSRWWPGPVGLSSPCITKFKFHGSPSKTFFMEILVNESHPQVNVPYCLHLWYALSYTKDLGGEHAGKVI